jgi:uncharacterized protein involved in tolerance to divalent cations
VNDQEGNSDRTYLQFGTLTTERDRERLECITTNDKVPALINYINANYPSTYDYPVPDVVSVPVERAHSTYIAWV